MAPVGGKPAHERRADSYRKTSGGYVANAIIHPRLWSIPRPGRRRFDPLRPFAAVVRMDEIVYDEEHVRLAVPIVADLKFDGKTYVLYDGESTNCYGEGRSYEEAVRMFSCERLNGFPDGWTEGMPESRRYFAMGNALVCGVIGRLGDGIGRIIDAERVPPKRFIEREG